MVRPRAHLAVPDQAWRGVRVPVADDRAHRADLWAATLRRAGDRPSPGRYVVVAGFGRRAQWFRNVEANPQVRVYLGSRAPVAAVARRLDPDATTASLRRYADAHPRSWAKLRPVLEETLGTRIDERGTELPMIALNLSSGR